MISFVIPYIHELARWQELKFCLRSINKNFHDGSYRIWLISDRLPEWSRGLNLIQTKRIANVAYSKWIDQQHKLLAAVNCNAVNCEFVWMYDDTYINEPATIKDFQILSALEDLSSVGNISNQLWKQLKMKTYKVLSAEGKSTHNYEKHIPYYFAKELVKSLDKKYNLKKEAYVLASLYYNTFFSKRKPLNLLTENNNLRCRIRKEFTSVAEVEQFTQGKKFLNHTDRALTPAVMRYLQKKFPEKSTFEK